MSHPSRSRPWCPAWRGGKGVSHSRRSLPLSAQCGRVASALAGPYSREMRPVTAGPAERHGKKEPFLTGVMITIRIYKRMQFILFINIMMLVKSCKRAARKTKILRWFSIVFNRNLKSEWKHIAEGSERSHNTSGCRASCILLACLKYLCSYAAMSFLCRKHWFWQRETCNYLQMNKFNSTGTCRDLGAWIQDNCATHL